MKTYLFLSPVDRTVISQASFCCADTDDERRQLHETVCYLMREAMHIEKTRGHGEEVIVQFIES